MMNGADGVRLPRPMDVNLWDDESARAIAAPVDPATVDFDPLSQL
jgi:hypothetical protein